GISVGSSTGSPCASLRFPALPCGNGAQAVYEKTVECIWQNNVFDKKDVRSKAAGRPQQG
ncbi:MAG: hypothetical protein ACK8QZ_11665, partial [Anaerolineales bacterium]